MTASPTTLNANLAATTALHAACVRADERSVLRALGAGADVNALDAEGRSVLWLALLGTSDIEAAASMDAGAEDDARVAVLTALLKSPNISLLTLNAAHIVTPLALAAWLNRPKSVLALLRDSDGAAAVDCMDAGGATPLMYAARDGSVDVARILLSHGARADLCDANDRTVVQHALGSPKILWMCELALRRQRFKSYARKIKLMAPVWSATAALQTLIASSLPPTETSYAPPSASRLTQRVLEASTRSVIEAVHVGNPDLLHSLLFPPQAALTSVTLVNLADVGSGLAPLHYAVSVEDANGDIIDALYRAGADMALPARDDLGSTPLHLFARHARDGPGAYQLAVRLVHELRCPLNAVDANGDTPLHIAAAYGASRDVLCALLDCDVDGAVQDTPNSRGLVPREVVQPQHAALFAPDGRPESAVTVRSPGATTAVEYIRKPGLPHGASTLSLSTSSARSVPLRYASPNDKLMLKPEEARAAARALAAALSGDINSSSDAEELRERLAETRQLSLVLISSWSTRLDNALDEATVLRAARERIGTVLAKARAAHKEHAAELSKREVTVRKKSSFLSGLRLKSSASSRAVPNVKSAPDLRAPNQPSSLMGALKDMLRGTRRPILEEPVLEEPASPTSAIFSPSIGSPASIRSMAWPAPVVPEETSAVSEAIVKNLPKLFARMDSDLKGIDAALAELDGLMSRAHHAISSADVSIEHARSRREDAVLELWFASQLERPEHEFGANKPLPSTPAKGLTQSQNSSPGALSVHARTSSIASSSRSRSRSFTSTAPTSLPASPTSSFPHHRHQKLPSIDGVVTVAADGLPALLFATSAALDAVEHDIERLNTWTRVARETIKAARRTLVA